MKIDFDRIRKETLHRIGGPHQTWIEYNARISRIDNDVVWCGDQKYLIALDQIKECIDPRKIGDFSIDSIKEEKILVEGHNFCENCNYIVYKHKVEDIKVISYMFSKGVYPRYKTLIEFPEKEERTELEKTVEKYYDALYKISSY